MLTKPDIERYFLAEKQAGLLVLIIGIIAVLIGIVFFFVFKGNLFKGAAVPLLALGIMECIVGNAIYKKSDADRMRIVYAYDMNPPLLKTVELPRMQIVNRKFKIYQGVEFGLAVLGILLMIYYLGETHRSFWVGFGLTLIIQSVLLFGMESMSAQRSKEYTRKLSGYLAAWPQRQ